MDAPTWRRNCLGSKSASDQELKARHPNIPGAKVAGIGNVLRHSYESISAPVMWKLAREDLPALEEVCRRELSAELAREGCGTAGDSV